MAGRGDCSFMSARHQICRFSRVIRLSRAARHHRLAITAERSASESTSARLSDVSHRLELRYGAPMPICKGCGEEVDALVSLKVDGKTKKLCEDCADLANEQSTIAEQSESAVQNMMGFTGRR